MRNDPTPWPILLLFPALLAGCIGSADAISKQCQASADGNVEPPDMGIRQCFVSPDRLKSAVVEDGLVSLVRNGATFTVGRMDYGEIVWLPTSDGFGVQDSQGSGQSGKFSFIDATASTPTMSDLISINAIRAFADKAQCSGPDWHANTYADGWTSEGDINLVVQDGVHSAGCTKAGTLIGVSGDPRTGRVSRILTADEVRSEWCSPEERLKPGYCYVQSIMQ